MNELNSLAPRLTGGNFLLAETDPAQVFTPEDLSSEQRLTRRYRQADGSHGLGRRV